MGTASGSDYFILRKHGFFRLYYDSSKDYRARLIDLARQSFSHLSQMRKPDPAPQPDEFVGLLVIDLLWSDVWHDLIAELSGQTSLPNPNSRDPFWADFFVEPVAHFLVDNEWDEIVS